MALAERHRDRVTVAVVGAPGSGKSLVSNAVARAFHALGGPQLAVLPMDGFHKSNAQLRQEGLSGRKGAPETFDAAACVARIRAVVDNDGPVRWPEYSRIRHDPVPDRLLVEPRVRIVLVEGNYLLLAEEPWCAAASLVTEAWYIEAAPGSTCQRLIQRHVSGGKSEEEARTHVRDVDWPNALRVSACAERATVRVIIESGDPALEGIVDPATGGVFEL